VNTRSSRFDAPTYYSERARAFHASYRSDPNRLERLHVWRSYLDRYSGACSFAYDIGCGSGILTCELARRACAVIAIDGASEMLSIAAKTAADAGVTNIKFVHSYIPIRDSTNMQAADLIMASSSLEYLESLDGALAFVKGLMKPGAVLIFSVSNRDSLSRKLVRIVHRFTGRPRYFGLVHHFLNEQSLRAVLQKTHLEYVEHCHLGGRDRLNRFLRIFVPERLATNMVLVVARKP
jgi:2-polyprenyl-3-methyl-5-hydroxy-6-metoxy-1,4-benzoquinol methylase